MIKKFIIISLILFLNLLFFGCLSEGSASMFHPCWQSKSSPSGTEIDKLSGIPGNQWSWEHYTDTDDTYMFFCYDKTGGTLGINFIDRGGVLHPGAPQVNYKWNIKGNQLCINKEIIPFGLLYGFEECKSYSFPSSEMLTWGDKNFTAQGQSW